MSNTASGKIGERLVFSQRKSGQQVRFQKAQKDIITSSRTSHRYKYNVAVSSWNNLSALQKDVYNDRADSLKMTGYNLFMKENIGYGPELVLNGSFSSSANWTVYVGGWSINGKANYSGSVIGYLRQNIQFTLNSWYHIEFDLSDSVWWNRWQFHIIGVGQLFAAPYNVFNYYKNGHYIINARSLYTSVNFSIRGNAVGAPFSLDNLSIKKIL